MNPEHTIRLLILNDSQAEAERLISMLQNAGKNVRPQLANAEIIEALLQNQAWDLFISEDEASDLDKCLQTIRRLNKDVAVILQTHRSGTQAVVEGMKRGANDVVALDEDQHLLLVIDREIGNRQQRQLRIQADKKRHEAEHQSHSLLDSSRDGIAYIQDGLCLYVNDSFAESFKYGCAEEIDCMPIIDLVAEQDQAAVKTYLQNFTLKGEHTETLQYSINGACSDETQQLINVEISHGSYEDEPCLKLRIPNITEDANLAEEMQKIKYLDSSTGTFNRQYLTDALNQAIHASEPKACVMLIEIDKFFEQVQPKVGLAASDAVLMKVAQIIQPECNDTDILARFADDAFMLVSKESNVDTIKQRCEKLLTIFNDTIIEAGGKTVQVTVSIGIALVNENTDSSDSIINQTGQALASIRNEQGSSSFKLYEPQVVSIEKTTGDDIQKAISAGRFRLLFQPVISLRGSGEEYYEVQLRMLDNNDEEVSPGKFLDTAKSSGAGAKLDRWVILESMKILAKQRSQNPKTKLMITLSTDSIADRSLLEWIMLVLNTAKINSSHVVFQISEKDANYNLKDTQAFLREVNEIKGFCAISNFGCSLDPANTLKHLDVDLLKLDGSFSLDIQNNNQSPEALLQLLADLHEAGKTTFIPQVENASILSHLWQGGVHYIQGHYLQAPSANMDYDFTMDG